MVRHEDAINIIKAWLIPQKGYKMVGQPDMKAGDCNNKIIYSNVFHNVKKI